MINENGGDAKVEVVQMPRTIRYKIGLIQIMSKQTQIRIQDHKPAASLRII